jgi:hypothetical protein
LLDAVRLSVAAVKPSELSEFKPVLYSEGQPFYEWEAVTAFVRVGSTGTEAALTVNQGGETKVLEFWAGPCKH